jgi:hypothetical protein
VVGVSSLELFVVGVAVTIPAAISIVAIVLAAIADGRENERMQAQIRAQNVKNDGDAE